ncbi:Ferrochelatase [Paraglaciecola mesophila]|uniref:Ferrochelatase n=1 Tax=Paraglaciecola mesophila TaxID=197222 RepID=A0A857JL77_9ALTE|nr:ferrochelatase [Paraglaciecola mesophila]QHJ12048.1 Ferrochelatase [Paraglaciecola mesophila]
MKYLSNGTFTHDQEDKIGVLITNLGTPQAPEKGALKGYLREFLSDPRVVEVPKLIWWMVLNLVILNIRPKRSAHAYSTVWTERGSPLMFHTQDQAKALAVSMKDKFGDKVLVDFAMRYGSPSIESVTRKMLEQGVRQLLVLPLYPQYSGSTNGSTFDALSQLLRKTRWIPDVRFISHYHDFVPYIDAVANSIKTHWATHGRADKLIFTYHGIPKRYLTAGDPYHCECYKTSRLVAEKLDLSKDEYMVTFQSRFGREEWLQPYTDSTLKALPEKGVKSVQMICPGFSADCLETIEEIGIENRDYFLQAGGERYEYIAALNAQPDHIAALSQLIEQNMAGWALPTRDVQLTAKLASELGSQS